MAVTLERFVQNLIASGLFSADELAAFQGRLPPEKQPQNPQDLARELIRAGKLTKYQAGLVYQGKTKGLVLGEYVILDQIGRGGMGQVFKARHRTMKRIVALKVLPQESMRSPRAVERFHREVKAAAKLSHPNIVTVHDASEHEGIHYLVIEYVDGQDLGQRDSIEVLAAQNDTVGIRLLASCGQLDRGARNQNGLIHGTEHVSKKRFCAYKRKVLEALEIPEDGIPCRPEFTP